MDCSCLLLYIGASKCLIPVSRYVRHHMDHLGLWHTVLVALITFQSTTCRSRHPVVSQEGTSPRPLGIPQQCMYAPYHACYETRLLLLPACCRVTAGSVLCARQMCADQLQLVQGCFARIVSPCRQTIAVSCRAGVNALTCQNDVCTCWQQAPLSFVDDCNPM